MDELQDELQSEIGRTHEVLVNTANRGWTGLFEEDHGWYKIRHYDTQYRERFLIVQFEHGFGKLNDTIDILQRLLHRKIQLEMHCFGYRWLLDDKPLCYSYAEDFDDKNDIMRAFWTFILNLSLKYNNPRRGRGAIIPVSSYCRVIGGKFKYPERVKYYYQRLIGDV